MKASKLIHILGQVDPDEEVQIAIVTPEDTFQSTIIKIHFNKRRELVIEGEET